MQSLKKTFFVFAIPFAFAGGIFAFANFAKADWSANAYGYTDEQISPDYSDMPSYEGNDYNNPDQSYGWYKEPVYGNNYGYDYGNGYDYGSGNWGGWDGVNYPANCAGGNCSVLGYNDLYQTLYNDLYNSLGNMYYGGYANPGTLAGFYGGGCLSGQCGGYGTLGYYGGYGGYDGYSGPDYGGYAGGYAYPGVLDGYSGGYGGFYGPGYGGYGAFPGANALAAAPGIGFTGIGNGGGNFIDTGNYYGNLSTYYNGLSNYYNTIGDNVYQLNNSLYSGGGYLIGGYGGAPGLGGGYGGFCNPSFQNCGY